MNNVNVYYCSMSVLQFGLSVLLTTKSINGVRLLSNVTRGLIVSSNSPLDFHDEIYDALAITLKHLFIG